MTTLEEILPSIRADMISMISKFEFISSEVAVCIMESLLIASCLEAQSKLRGVLRTRNE